MDIEKLKLIAEQMLKLSSQLLAYVAEGEELYRKFKLLLNDEKKRTLARLYPCQSQNPRSLSFSRSKK